MEAGKLGKLQVVNGSEVLLGPPFIYTRTTSTTSTSSQAHGPTARTSGRPARTRGQYRAGRPSGAPPACPAQGMGSRPAAMGRRPRTPLQARAATATESRASAMKRRACRARSMPSLHTLRQMPRVRESPGSTTAEEKLSNVIVPS